MLSHPSDYLASIRTVPCLEREAVTGVDVRRLGAEALVRHIPWRASADGFPARPSQGVACLRAYSKVYNQILSVGIHQYIVGLYVLMRDVVCMEILQSERHLLDECP